MDETLDATRAVYDATVERFVAFAGTAIGPATETPLDRAVLRAFAEEAAAVAGSAPGRVADVGCGPGRAAAFLDGAGLGLEVVGVDLAPAMVAAAQAAHPHLRFEVAPLTELPFPDGALVGAVAWYSIIHTPADGLDAVARELRRVLRPEAPVLVAFQSGDGEVVERADAHGTGRTLTSHRHAVELVAGVLDVAGLAVTARVVRAAALPHETTDQAFVFGRRPPT